MKRLMLPLLAALVAMLAVAAVAAGGNKPAKGHGTLELVATEVSFNFVDVDPKQTDPNGAPTPGDSFLIHEDITKHGKAFGKSYIQCTFITADAAQCLATLDLANGQITVHGTFVGETSDFTFAVTGGTGDYTGAGGTIRIQDNEEEDSPTHYTIQFRLALPGGLPLAPLRRGGWEVAVMTGRCRGPASARSCRSRRAPRR